MDALLGELQGMGFAQYLRSARWSYAALSATHIFAIALLVGGILPLDLRLLGLWRHVPREALVRVLVPMAATGLALALVTGFLLFSVRAQEYAGIGFLQIKLVLVLTGVASAMALHGAHGFLLAGASDARLAGHAVLSMTCWLGALICGRMIAFAAV